LIEVSFTYSVIPTYIGMLVMANIGRFYATDSSSVYQTVCADLVYKASHLIINTLKIFNNCTSEWWKWWFI